MGNVWVNSSDEYKKIEVCYLLISMYKHKIILQIIKLFLCIKNVPKNKNRYLIIIIKIINFYLPISTVLVLVSL